MFVRNRPTPGTPMAKSASFFSANSFTWRGVMICSASAFRSSGFSGCISSVVSSPLSRTVGWRPTLSSRSEPLRWTMYAIACLKLNGVSAAAAVGSPIGVDPEQHLAILHGRGVVHENLAHDARELGFDLVHDLHRLDDAHGLARRDARAHLDIGIGPGLRTLVER